jgi:hypothetical protein
MLGFSVGTMGGCPESEEAVRRRETRTSAERNLCRRSRRRGFPMRSIRPGILSIVV